MSIFESMFGSPKKEAPVGEEKGMGNSVDMQESDVPTNPEAVQGIYTNKGEVLSETEAKEIIENRKDEGWREQQ